MGPEILYFNKCQVMLILLVLEPHVSNKCKRTYSVTVPKVTLREGPT